MTSGVTRSSRTGFVTLPSSRKHCYIFHKPEKSIKLTCWSTIPHLLATRESLLMTVVRWLDHFHSHNLQHDLPPPFPVRPLFAVISCGRDHSMSKRITVGVWVSNIL